MCGRRPVTPPLSLSPYLGLLCLAGLATHTDTLFFCTAMTPRRSARLAATPAPPSRSRSRPAPKGCTRHDAHATSFEFCGPVAGPLAMLFGLPAVCYALLATCNASGCVSTLRDLLCPSRWPGLPAAGGLVSGAGFVAVFAWFFAQAAIHVALPGTRRKGVVLASGKRLEYKLTGENVGVGDDHGKPKEPSERETHPPFAQAPPTFFSPWPRPPPPLPSPARPAPLPPWPGRTTITQRC